MTRVVSKSRSVKQVLTGLHTFADQKDSRLMMKSPTQKPKTANASAAYALVMRNGAGSGIHKGYSKAYRRHPKHKKSERQGD